MIKNNFHTVKATFNKWNENRTSLHYKINDGEFIAAEDEEFRPLYTTDKNDKFYKIRKDIPSNYWISDRGNLINVNPNSKNEKITALKPSYSGEEDKRREQYAIKINNHQFKPDPAELVALAFDGKATQKALELINEHGIDALRAINHQPAMVQLHHISHYKHVDIKDMTEMRAENCRIENLMLIASDEHDIISNAPRYRVLKDGEQPTDKEEKAFDEYSKRLGKLGKDYTKPNTVVIEQTGARKQAGDVHIDDESFLKYYKQPGSEPWMKYIMKISEIPREMSDNDFVRCLIALVDWKPEDFKQFLKEDERGKEFLRIYQNEIFKSEPKCIEYINKFLKCVRWYTKED